MMFMREEREQSKMVEEVKAKARPKAGQPKLEEKCKFCLKVHEPRKCPAFGKKCHKCGQSNHFARFVLCKKTKSKVDAVTPEEGASSRSERAGSQYGSDLYGGGEEARFGFLEKLMLSLVSVLFLSHPVGVPIWMWGPGEFPLV